jgi:hypothetical protein
MLPWSKAVCCTVVSVGQGDEGIACMGFFAQTGKKLIGRTTHRQAP